MTQPQHIDPERLAALLDGRLGPAEAAAVRQQLADADDDTLAAYADAVAVSEELAHGEAKEAGVIPIDSMRRGRRWLAVAALAAAGVVAMFVYRSTSTTDAYFPAMYASAIPGTARMGVEEPWSATRGASDGLSERARAVRVGVLLTDLELDAIRGDTTKTHAAALRVLLDAQPNSAQATSALQEIVAATTVAPSRQRVQEIGKLALTLVDQPFANAGAYLEAARIAMFSGDSTFLDRIPPRPVLQLKNDARLDATTKEELRPLEADMKTRPHDVSHLGMQFTALLQMLAQ